MLRDDNEVRAGVANLASGPTAVRTISPTVRERPNAAKFSSSSIADATITSTDWLRQFRTSTNLRPLVQNAASAARSAHDGRAAYTVYLAMIECGVLLRAARQGPDALQEHLRYLTGLTAVAPEQIRKKSEKSVGRCMALTTPALFENVQMSDSDGENAAYWRDLAASEGDPLAMMEALNHSKPVRRTDLNGNTRELSGPEIALEVAHSNDPAALFTLGQRIFSDTKNDDRMDGMALSLAVCMAGYDCTGANPDFGWDDCDVSGACVNGRDYASIVQQSLSASEYAAVYAKSQAIQSAIQRGDQTLVDAIVSHARL